jgi:ABC-type Zn uptake system ZnuABC Zn-binding protein ZnuA
VKAIFAESSVNPKLEELIADQSGATIGKALWADTLGPAGSDGDTYLKSIASNTREIASGLSGGTLDCRLPD